MTMTITEKRDLQAFQKQTQDHFASFHGALVKQNVKIEELEAKNVAQSLEILHHNTRLIELEEQVRIQGKLMGEVEHNVGYNKKRLDDLKDLSDSAPRVENKDAIEHILDRLGPNIDRLSISKRLNELAKGEITLGDAHRALDMNVGERFDALGHRVNELEHPARHATTVDCQPHGRYQDLVNLAEYVCKSEGFTNPYREEARHALVVAKRTL